MANLTVKIYSHEKKADGKWTYVPVDIDLDTRSTKTVAGAFKISWYAGGAKQFSKGHFPFLADAIRAGQEKRLELRDAMNVVAPTPTEPGRVRIDVAAEAYLKFTKLRRRPGSYHLAEHDVQEFQRWNNENSKRTYVDQISADDLLTYRNWLLGHGYKFERDKDRKITVTTLHTGTRSPRTAVNKGGLFTSTA